MTEITDPPNVPDPTTGPDRVSAPADYDAQTTTFRIAQRAFAVSLPPIATWMKNLAVLIKGWATSASASAATAEAAKDATIASGGATAWVSGGTFVEGEVRWSLVNYRSYRAKTNHTGLTADPSVDGTNWAPLTPEFDPAPLETRTKLFALWTGA